MSDLICVGCGTPLQSEDPKKIGYVPSTALKQEHIICQRCFKIKNYNESTTVDMSSNDFLQILSSIGYKDALVVLVVDLFDFSGSMVRGLNRLVQNNQVVLIGNKRDLLPKAINDNKIKNWVKKQAKDFGLKYEDVALVSAMKGHGIDDAMSLIDEYRENRDVYIVGCTNVGKSTFINQILKRFGDETKDWITTSFFPGTTLGMIEVPIDEDSFLIDTPGIINEHQYGHYVSTNTLKLITPKNEIKQRIYQLAPKQTLYVGGLARFDFIRGNYTSVVCFFSNMLDLHRTKLENADTLYEKNITKLLNPPTEEEFKQLPPLKRHAFTINGKKDIVVSGLGWFRIEGKNMDVAVHAPNGVGVFLRDSII